MSHILFAIYTLLFGIAYCSDKSGHILFGAVTALAVILWLFRNLHLLGRGSYYVRKVAVFLVLVPIPILYLLLPHPVASAVGYAFITLWLYGIPGGRLWVLRMVYTQALKAACRRRNFAMERVRGGFLLRTPAKVYDLRLIGSFRRVSVIALTDETHYTTRLVPPYISQNPERLRDLLDASSGEGRLLRHLLMGKARAHELQWTPIVPDGRTVERVMLFWPGLCEWRLTHGDTAATNGSVIHGITLYEADAFVENRLS